MRILIYTAGILGLISLSLWFFGSYVGIPQNYLMLYIGLALFCIIFLPLFSIDRYLHNRRHNRLIRAIKNQVEVK